MAGTGRSLSNWEYAKVLEECRGIIGRHLDKVYELKAGVFRFDFGKDCLVAGIGTYFYITQNPPAAPQNPSSFAMMLRKYAGGLRLAKFESIGGDRIYSMEFSDGGKILLEQFGRGNLLLLDKEKRVIGAFHAIKKDEKKGMHEKRQKQAHYEFSQKENEFSFPPGEKEWHELAKPEKAKLAVEAALARWPVGKIYTSEAIRRAGIDGKEIVAQVGAEKAEKFLHELAKLMENAKPAVYANANGEAIEVSLCEVPKYNKPEFFKKEFSSWAEALEFYFSNAKKEEKKKENEKLAKLEKRLGAQKEMLRKLESEIELHQKQANWMENNLVQIEEKINGAKEKEEKKLEIKICD